MTAIASATATELLAARFATPGSSGAIELAILLAAAHEEVQAVTVEEAV